MEDKKKKSLDFMKLKKENFVVVFLIGVLLLVIAWPAEEKTKQSETETGITDTNNGIIGISEEADMISAGAGSISEKETQDYVSSLERTLEEILSAMEGAGRVKVMITLKSSAESVIEKDTVSSRVSSTEVDSAGGSRNSADVSAAEETVYTDSGGAETPFIKQVIFPQIEGVVVCAQGAGSDAVNKNITEAIQALFGIDVHKIKVIKMSSK